MVTIGDFAQRLQQLEGKLLELTWLAGRNPDAPWDGGHFAIPGTPRPLSVSRAEARFLANFTALLRAENVLEIGTGFGYSAVWIAFGMSSHNASGYLYTVDDGSEGILSEQARTIANQLWSGTQLAKLIRSVRGSSPDAVRSIGLSNVDLVFIDGEHRNGQPLLDYRVAFECLADNGVVVFHDAQEKYDVNEAVHAAAQDGFKIVKIPTSCEPVVAVRTGEQECMARTALLLAKNNLIIGVDEWVRS